MFPGKRGARAGLVVVAGHFPPQISIRLKMLAAEQRSTVQALLGEAIDLLFARRRGSPLAQEKITNRKEK